MVADLNTLCARGVGVVVRRYCPSDGAFTEERDGWRRPQGQLLLFPVWWREPGLGFPLGTVLFSKGILLPAKRGKKLCAQLKKKVI